MLRKSQIAKRQRKLSNRFDRAAQDLTKGAITLEEFQTIIASNLKQETVSITKTHAGRNVTQSHWGLNGSALRRQYGKLNRFAIAIKEGRLTKRQIRARARFYSKALFQWFHELEVYHSTRSRNHNEALRFTDPSSEHCSACPNYDTGGNWIPIDQVVPVGTACPCGGNCRCTVITRFNANLVEQVQQLSQRVATNQRRRSRSEPSLERILQVLTGRRRTRFI